MKRSQTERPSSVKAMASILLLSKKLVRFGRTFQVCITGVVALLVLSCGKDPASQDSEKVAKYPSQPFEGYSEATGNSVVDAVRYKSGFGNLTDSEAAYKALLIDAHYLYYGFIKCFPNSEFTPQLSKQLSRFKTFQATSGKISSTVMVTEFHWNRQTARDVWTMGRIIWAGDIPVDATMAMGNLQWQGTAYMKDKHLVVESGTIIIYPSIEMSKETTEYRDAVGIKAGYLPDASASEKPFELYKRALSYANKTSERDKIDEIKLLTRAAMMGYAPAQLELGVAMINGEWLTYRPVDAGKMLLLAAKAGNQSAEKIWQKACAEKFTLEEIAEIEKLVAGDSGRLLPDNPRGAN
jgi:hypothetical protein